MRPDSIDQLPMAQQVQVYRRALDLACQSLHRTIAGSPERWLTDFLRTALRQLMPRMTTTSHQDDSFENKNSTIKLLKCSQQRRFTMGLWQPLDDADDFNGFSDDIGFGEAARDAANDRAIGSCPTNSSSSPIVKWIVRGRQLQVGSQVYNLRHTYAYGYEPATLSRANRNDCTPTAYLCYRVPVPGAKPYVVDLTSSDSMLRPLTLTQPSHPVPTDQIMWMVVFSDEVGKAVRKVLRDYLKVS